MKRTVSAVIVAGGEGKRMGTDVPKQFLELSGKPVVIHTIDKFCNSADIDSIVIVCIPAFVDKLKDLIREYDRPKIYAVVPGGKTRQESSYKGLKACPPQTEYVLIHDAVRPFVDDRMIKETLDAAVTGGASTAAIAVKDTILREENGIINEILDRENLRRVQTPQGFKYANIIEAHENALREGVFGFTDDCGLLMNSGFPVMLVEGSEKNIKITTGEDLIFAEKNISL